jgi:hypothetical protein
LQGILNYIEKVVAPSFTSLSPSHKQQPIETPSEDLQILSAIEEDLEKANHQCDLIGNTITNFCDRMYATNYALIFKGVEPDESDHLLSSQMEKLKQSLIMKKI